LALKKATGTNLSIIEVPEALFHLNEADLGATTKKIFGQEAQSFYFDDATVCDSNFLRNTRNRLRSTITNREYLITTKESMQAFELKYLKFLEFMDESNKNDMKKAKVFSEICKIFKYQGDVIIDEIDSTLDVRKQLIYTVGTGTSVPVHELKAVLELYNFFDKVKLTKIKSFEESTLQDILLGNVTPNTADWPLVFSQLSEQLLNHESSPLKSLLVYLSAHYTADQMLNIKRELFDYLLGEAKAIPACINNLTQLEEKNSSEKTMLMELQDKIAIFKEEITSVLPLTLKKNLAEHFGLSKDLSKEDIEREIAIPYLASNTPSEKSHFGNYLETINYTLRIQLYKPLAPAVVKAMVMHYKSQEDEEKRQAIPRVKPFDYKSPAQKFFELTKMDLNEIDFDDMETFENFYDLIKNNSEVKEHCILNHILNHVKKSDRFLASDAQNHGSQFRSVQGMTGTDWNYRCYPNFIKINKDVSKGSDGQTRNHLLKDPQPVHCLASAKNVPEKMSVMLELFSKHPKKSTLHAWIDLGAFFKGITNSEVANQFATYFSSKPEFSHLKFVLFFDADNKLYAKSTDESKKDSNPILLEQSSPEFISDKLGCGPESIFSYYDQRRITGTDIKQDVNAHAFVPLGVKTLDRDLLQSVMRMRELKNQQRVEFIVPKELQDVHPEIKPDQWNVEIIMKLCIDNQIERLAEDHFRAALQKMQNVLRNDLFERLLAVDPHVQKAWMKVFDQVFFTTANKSAFKQFSDVTEKVNTSEVLNGLGENVIKTWLDVMSEAKVPDVTPDEVSRIQNGVRGIISSSISICNKEVEQLKSERFMLESQVEVSKEQEAEKELDQETDYRIQNDVVPRAIKEFDDIDFTITTIEADKALGGVAIQTLEAMAKTASLSIPRKWEFSSNICVTENYQHTHFEQAQKTDGFKKDATFFLIEQNDSIPKTIKFLLLTNEEAGSLGKQLQNFNQDGNKKIWIETVHNTCKAGIKPAILHPDYQKGIEQISFFNADTDILYAQFKSNSWLNENAKEKMNYLQYVIQPTHKDKVDMLGPLKERIFSGPEEKKTIEIAVGVEAKPKEKIQFMTGDFRSRIASSAITERTQRKERERKEKIELVKKERAKVIDELSRELKPSATVPAPVIQSRLPTPVIQSRAFRRRIP